jgi:phosphatidate cytidylyltransferase
MVAEGNDRGGRFEDAFDDLDSYFGATYRAGRVSESRSVSQGQGQPPSGSPGLEDELLPPGWAPDVESLHLEESELRPHADKGREETEPESPEPQPAEPEATDVERAPDATGSDAAPSEGGTSMWRGEPWEMAGEDWRRLRDVLGEEEGGEAPDFGRGPAPEAREDAPGVYLPGDAPGAEEGPDWLPSEREELTIDDLKKPPPEYRDLPGVHDATVEPEVMDAGDTEPPEGEVAEITEVEEEQPTPEAVEERDWEEPDIAEVEAAADQLAYEFRDAREPEEVEKELLADLDRPAGPRTVRVGPEGMTGPAWEEPTSRVVMAEPASPIGAGRDMPAALLTAAVLAASALISLAVSKAAFAVVAGLVVLLGQAELYGTMNKRGHQPATALGLVVGALILAGAYLKGEAAMLFFVALGLMLSFLWYMAAAPKSREGAIGNIGTTMLGIVYVPFLAAYMLVVLSQPNSGRATMMAILGLTFLYDVAAFVIGSFWGARALAPSISPKKSWEGLFGATVITVTVAIAVLPSVNPIDSVTRAVGLALVVVLFAPLGDLAESAIKRDLGVKDMGSILPGHGGVLDRIDSVLLVAPAAFYFLRLVF